MHGACVCVCVCVLCLALLDSAESDVVLALEGTVGAMANGRLYLEPANAVLIEEVSGSGRGNRSVFHDKEIVERLEKTASILMKRF